MSGFTANLDELQAVVERLANFGAMLDDRVAELDAASGRLAGQWDGIAAQEHADAHARWSRGAQQMQAGLDGMRRCVQVAHDNYRAAASANLAMWP